MDLPWIQFHLPNGTDYVRWSNRFIHDKNIIKNGAPLKPFILHFLCLCLCGYAYANGQGKVMGKTCTLSPSQLSTLEAWDFRNCQMGPQLVRILTPKLQGSNVVKDLRLTGNKLGDAAASNLLELLTSQAQIETLDLSDNDLTEGSAPAIRDFIAHNPNLKTLDLAHNKLGDGGISTIASSMTQHPSLYTLNLDNTDCGDAGATALHNALKTNNMTLNHLFISHNRISAHHPIHDTFKAQPDESHTVQPNRVTLGGPSTAFPNKAPIPFGSQDNTPPIPFVTITEDPAPTFMSQPISSGNFMDADNAHHFIPPAGSNTTPNLGFTHSNQTDHNAFTENLPSFTEAAPTMST